MKPLLQVTNQEAAISAKEDELRAAREKLEAVEADLRESLMKADQVQCAANHFCLITLTTLLPNGFLPPAMVF